MISGFRFGFLGITDVPLFTTVAVLVVFIIAFYLLCWYLIQRGRGCAANLCPATFCLPGTFFDSYHRKLTFTPLNYLPAKEGVMLGWVITCHDELAQEMLDRLKPNLVRWRSAGRSITGAIQHQYAEPDDVRCAA
jgi:hypothetical protein